MIEKHNFLNKEILYIKNGLITEYDMKNGGISILKHKQLITNDEYNWLMRLDKHQRDVTIGKWLKTNKDISKELMNGFKEARQLFFETNKIDDSKVLAIKKDAIFLVETIAKVQQVNKDYLFRIKNQYTTYMNILGKEFYYNQDKDVLDVKGFTNETINHQSEYLFKFVKECLLLDSESNSDELFTKLLEFKDSFVRKELPVEYYYDVIFDGYLFNYKTHKAIIDVANKDMINNEFFNYNTNLKFILQLISNLLK